MEEQKKVTVEQDASEQDASLSDDELTEVAGGTNIQKTRLEFLDNQSKSVGNKSVDDVQKTRLEHLDNQTK